MKKAIFFIILLSSIFSKNCWGEVLIKADIDKDKITTDEALTYKITINSSDKDAPQLELPKFDGFQVISQAQSSTLSFSKSGAKSHLVYVYILAPQGVGKFKISPAVIKIKGRNYSTQSFEVEVIQGEVHSVPRIPNTRPRPDKPGLEPEQSEYVL